MLLTTAFVLFLSPIELQQVTDLKREEEALQKKLADHMKEKAALEGEVAKLDTKKQIWLQMWRH